MLDWNGILLTKDFESPLIPQNRHNYLKGCHSQLSRVAALLLYSVQRWIPLQFWSRCLSNLCVEEPGITTTINFVLHTCATINSSVMMCIAISKDSRSFLVIPSTTKSATIHWSYPAVVRTTIQFKSSSGHFQQDNGSLHTTCTSLGCLHAIATVT